MSDAIITSGGYKPNKAKVNEDGQLNVAASTHSTFTHQAQEHRLSYEFHPSSTSVYAAQYTPLFWMQNTSSNLNFHIQYVRLGWNGGSTTWIKSASFRMYVGMSKPDGNAIFNQFGTGTTSHNMYIGSEINAEMDVAFHDKTGTDGMTIASTYYSAAQFGEQINCGQIGQGATYIKYDGALILPPSERIGIAMKSEEDGKGITVLAGYYQPVEFR